MFWFHFNTNKYGSKAGMYLVSIQLIKFFKNIANTRCHFYEQPYLQGINIYIFSSVMIDLLFSIILPIGFNFKKHLANLA
jgi:hypothetical protein